MHRWRGEARPLRGKGQMKIRTGARGPGPLLVVGGNFRHPQPEKEKNVQVLVAKFNFFGAKGALVAKLVPGSRGNVGVNI